MKIRQINNNVSHKAYFKPNNEFKYLYGKMPSGLLSPQAKEKFLELPNHELEIIGIASHFVKNGYENVTVFNNNTKKSIDCVISKSVMGMRDLILSLTSFNERNMTFFNESSQQKQVYEELVNNQTI